MLLSLMRRGGYTALQLPDNFAKSGVWCRACSQSAGAGCGKRGGRAEKWRRAVVVGRGSQ